MKKKKQAPKAQKKPRVNRIVLPSKLSTKIAQNGMTRPKPTRRDGKPKTTARVWQIADEISAKHAAIARAESKKTKKKVTAKPATRQEVLNQCKKEGMKYSTFSNQFYRWRKFNGLFGRIRKDGTKALPQGPGHGQPKTPKRPKVAEKPAPKPAVAPKPVVATLSSQAVQPLGKPPVKPTVATKPPFPPKPAFPAKVAAA